MPRARILASCLAALLIAAASPGPAPASTAAPIVRSIEITGTRAVDPAVVSGGLGIKAGDALTEEARERAVRQLFATGLFSDVRIGAGKNGRISVSVVERPRVTKVAFEGNAAIETAKLAAAIALKRGEVYTPARLKADEIKLRDLYRREGRYRTTIASTTREDQAGGIDVTFRIAEGAVNKVERISFSGNRAFSAGQLRDVITTTQSGWLDLLKSNLTYDKERLAIDRVLLREHYLRNGYPDATVAEPTVETIPETGGFAIAFAVDEGERFTFGAQRVDARVEGLDGAALATRIKAGPGAIYDKRKIEETVTAIQAAIAGSHPFARVAARPETDPAQRSIAVAYTIEDGPRILIRRIEISGNVRTRDQVIRRELKLSEGSAYNPALVEAARLRVQRTGFFKTVELKPEKTDAPDTVDLRLAVVEQETGELSFGVGFSQNDGIIGDISFADRNVLGTGYAAKVKLQAGERRYGAEIGFTDPHFLGSDVAAGFDLFYRDTDRSLQSSYKEQRAGGTVRLAAPISDTITTGLSYSFTRSTLYDVGPDASAAIKEAAGLGGGTHDTSAIGTSVTFDTRDKRKLPTSGVLTSVRQDFAGVGGDARFVRTSADVRAYTPVAAGIVLSGHMGGGVITGWGGQDVRLLDLFYRGGETVRGFAAGGIGPRDSASANADALGGRMFYVASTEVRAPIPFVPPELGLSVIGFVDAGSLFSANQTAAALPGLSGNSAAPRISTGAGLVWDSPVGPLQATYSFVLAKQPGDKTQPLGFGLGSGF